MFHLSTEERTYGENHWNCITKASRSQSTDYPWLRKCVTWEAIHNTSYLDYLLVICVRLQVNFLLLVGLNIRPAIFSNQKCQFCAQTWYQDSVIIAAAALKLLKPDEPVGPARWQRAERPLGLVQTASPILFLLYPDIRESGQQKPHMKCNLCISDPNHIWKWF